MRVRRGCLVKSDVLAGWSASAKPDQSGILPKNLGKNFEKNIRDAERHKTEWKNLNEIKMAWKLTDDFQKLI